MEKTSAVKGNDDFAINFPKATVESKSLTTGILLVIPHWMQSDKSKRVPLNLRVTLECFSLKLLGIHQQQNTSEWTFSPVITALQSVHAVMIAARDTQGSTNFPTITTIHRQNSDCWLTLKGGKKHHTWIYSFRVNKVAYLDKQAIPELL